MTELRRLVAETADATGEHATAPALLLELQSRLGELSALASGATERGRRPFRPPAGWGQALGELAYTIYQLADQTGIDLDGEAHRAAYTHRARVAEQGPARPSPAPGPASGAAPVASDGWPFSG